MKTHMFAHMGGDWRIDDEFIYTYFSCFEKYEDSHILVVAGGPSTNVLDWEPKNYDYIWSLNQFYLNPKLANTNVDLITVSGEINLLDGRFHDYLEKYHPWVGFEPHHRWMRNPIETTAFQKSHDKIFAYASRFYGKIGGGVRLIILACVLGAKKISFVGLDGPKPIFEGNHAFEPGKNLLPSEINEQNADEVFTFQYDIFWDYIQNLYPKVIFDSLDKTNKYHAKISR